MSMLALPPLSTDSYKDVLRKISIFCFIFVWLVVLWVRSCDTTIDIAMRQFEDKVSLGGIYNVLREKGDDINLTGIVLGITYAIISHMLTIHDKISNIFCVRKRFDIHIILIPLALLCGSNLKIRQINALPANRHSLMRSVFYRYTVDRSVVNEHDVRHALTAWSWVWLCIECTFVLIITGLVLVLSGHVSCSAGMFALSLLFIIMIPILTNKCDHYAKSELEQIAENQQARSDVKRTFDAL